MSILMFLHFLMQLITGLHFEAPAIPEPTAVVAPAPQHDTHTSPAPVETPAPVVTPPAVTQAPAPVENEPETSCQPGEEWQGEFGCVATQLPEETDGRQY